MRALLRAKLALAAVLGAAGTASAQDRHEWSLGYGELGALIGGAATGSVRDPSAGYYNPGALSFVKDAGVSVFDTVMGYQRFALDGVAGTNRNLVASDIEWTPVMLAGLFHPREGSKQTVAWSVLTRARADLRVDGRAEAIVDVVAGLPGPERYTATYEARSLVHEAWIGVGPSMVVIERGDNRLAVGFTQFITFRSGLASTVVDAAAFNPFSGGNAVSRDRRRAEYLLVGLAWKLGVAADLAPFRLGLTLTPPSVHLFGQGEMSWQQASAGVDLTGDSFPDPYDQSLADDHAEARWHRPAAVAFGGSFEWDPWRVHLGVEWTAAQGAYAVLRTDQALASPPMGGVAYDFRHSQHAVLNAGVGVERVFAEKLRGVAGLWTDFSTGPEATDSAVTLAQWDLFHVGAGVAWTLEGATLWLGLITTFGTGELDQPANFSQASEATRLFGGPSTGDVFYLGLRLTVAYRFTF